MDIHSTPLVCFEHSCGHPQGGALQRYITKVFEPMHTLATQG